MFRRRFTVTNQDSGIKPEEQLAIVAFLGVLFYVTIGKQFFDFIDKTKIFFDNLWENIVELGLFLITLKGILILLAILSPLIIYLNYWLNNTIADKLMERRDEKKKLYYQERDIKELLTANVEFLDVHKLGRYITSINDEIDDLPERFEKYKPELLKKLEDVEKLHEIKKHESRIKGFKLEEEKHHQVIDYLERDILRLDRERKGEKKRILRKLDWQGTSVFYKEELNDEECEVLKEHNYKQVNEYDIFSRQVRPFLVKCPLNHSPTHTFLVWSMKKLVEEIKDVDKIEEHLTKDADLTFRYKKKYYALEIETGNLLSKKDQLQQKVLSLNRKYGKRWMFVVSNQEDLPAYRKWGKSTQRTEVEKVLETWLE